MSEEYLFRLKLRLWDKKRKESIQKYAEEKCQSAKVLSQQRTERQIWTKLCGPFKETGTCERCNCQCVYGLAWLIRKGFSIRVEEEAVIAYKE